MYAKYIFPNVEPKIVCPPLKKGRYNFTKIVVDLTPFLNLPIEDKEWKQSVIAKTVKSNRIIFCASGIMKVFAQSSRKRV